MKKLLFLLIASFFIFIVLSGCNSLKEFASSYQGGNEVCTLDTTNISKFTYKTDSYTILQDITVKSEIGSLVGSVRKIVVLDEYNTVISQVNIGRNAIENLKNTPNNNSDNRYSISFFDVYSCNSDVNTLFIDIDGKYHKAILSNNINNTDIIFKPEKEKDISTFTINSKNCTQILCNTKVYQITDSTIKDNEKLNYLGIIGKSVVFDKSTKLEIPSSELNKVDWKGDNHQQREQWFYGDIYSISDYSIDTEIAIKINNNYLIAKCVRPTP